MTDKIYKREDFEYELERKLKENHKLLIDVSYIRHGEISVEFTSRFCREKSATICNSLFNGKANHGLNRHGEIEIIVQKGR